MNMADPAARFETHRRYLVGLAYRMLGSLAEAEDAVQDAYLRWHAAVQRQAVEDARGFLARTVARLCLDRLKSARARRETYVGPWLPEPLVENAGFVSDDADSEFANDLSVALMLTLERLSPLERAAFLLHDVFDLPFTEVASTLDRSEAACRQLAARAREHVRTERPRFQPSNEVHAKLVEAFVEAARSGDPKTISRFLSHDAVFISDGGGKVPAALNPVQGADKVARLIAGIMQKSPPPAGAGVRFARINDLPGLIFVGPGGPIQTVAFGIREDGLIGAIYTVRNTDKLRHVH